MIDLKRAKYKGVEFLFADMPTTGGNRLIKFNYPGSDKQAIERQGKVPRTFNMTAIIPHDNYYLHRDLLLRVLEDGEKGTLTHPTFGDVENVINGQYTLTERLTELGRAEISIPFEVDDAPGIPQQSGNLASQVQAQSDLLNAQLAADLGGTYDVDLSFSGNFSDALENLGNVSESFAQASEFAEPVAENVSAFRASINTFSSSAGNLIQVPADLATSVGGLFEDLNNLYSTPETLLGAFDLLFPFGEDDPEVQTNTVGRVQRKQNRDLMRANIRVQALSYSYLNAAEAEYDTTEDLELAQDNLEAQYLDARNNQLLSNEALEALDRVRVQAQKALDAARVNTRSIITIETPLIPLTILVYDYYGATDLVETIAELNSINQNAFVEGEIRILTI
jgi:prophage DNA circulation protein